MELKFAMLKHQGGLHQSGDSNINMSQSILIKCNQVVFRVSHKGYGYKAIS